MERPLPGPETELIPAPPKLDTRRLWLTLLLPGGLTALCMIGIAAAGDQGWGNVFGPGCWVVGIASIVCWIGFSNCIYQRFQGAPLILLILAYPIAQAVLVFVIFFAGCLIMVSQGGLY